MDLTGPLIESEGYKYILTFIDHFTKWIETRPLKTKNARDVATGVFSIYCRQGAPVQIVLITEENSRIRFPKHFKKYMVVNYYSQLPTILKRMVS